MFSVNGYSNKQYAYALFQKLIEKKCLSDGDINLLIDAERCKLSFCCSNVPILSEVSVEGPLQKKDCYDNYGRQRFYKEKVIINSRAFVITNHWYGPGKSMPDNRTPFEHWALAKINK
ncbi:hypothetical protein [Sporosarcina ureae]|uniref:hypothetical protein n=1 Tax=Sporosarcina ureae TaxID=1571 RepID=UPI000A17C676|nr:hypothetical protein [Sporosarcina ureae]ARK20940.1 hypothetical protein SporoP32a_04945 [Sporosarcina ureae]